MVMASLKVSFLVGVSSLIMERVTIRDEIC